MDKRRIFFHVLFWAIQYSINLYTELYLSVSFSNHPSAELFFLTALAICLPLSVTMAATYYVLYALIPRWIQNHNKPVLYLEGLMVVVIATLGIRCMIQFVVWRYVYGDAGPELTATQWIARYFYSMLGLLQVLGLAAAIKLFKLRINAIKNEKSLMQEKLHSELLHLKSQLNPHFLFNAINSIYSLARRGAEQTADAVMRLSRILRYVIYETEQKTIPLQDELKVMADYIELQQLRFGTRLQISFEKTLDEPGAAIAPMLLLPLAENAYKHGSEEGGNIDIYIRLRDKLLTFAISNPVTKTNSVRVEKEGIGLSNIRRQLELMYRDHSLHTTLKDNTFKAELNIRLDSYAGSELFDHRR